jgi:GNAT superfamily N-acetyltransferase
VTEDQDVVIRSAERGDVETIVRLLADDPLGVQRETKAGASFPKYLSAFDEISSDPNNLLAVAITGSEVVGVLQLTLIPSLTYQGAWRAQIEGVRVSASSRSSGVGTQLIQWAIGCAKERGCRLMQLTTDRQRPEALAFYERQGFAYSHCGLKMDLLAERVAGA